MVYGAPMLKFDMEPAYRRMDETALQTAPPAPRQDLAPLVMAPTPMPFPKAFDNFEMIFLGTGSAIPSKYRNGTSLHACAPDRMPDCVV